MAWAHISGIADDIDDFFSIFENFITTTVGWTVASGAGTTDLVITSIGEAAGFTMLFARLYQLGGVNTNRINGNVRNDAVGTQQTTHTGYLDSGGDGNQAFPFWITADMDTIVIVTKAGRSTRWVYLGCLLPFAITPVDETYYIVVADNTATAARILRRHDGLWNQTDTTYENLEIRSAGPDRYDGSAIIGECHYADSQDIAGQFRHISEDILCPMLSPGDIIESTQPGATSKWQIFAGQAGVIHPIFALHIEGTLPTGEADGAGFVHQRGVAATAKGFIDGILAPFLTGIGWTCADHTGHSGLNADQECYSPGESGTEDIWIRIAYDIAFAPDRLEVAVQDDSVHTHITTWTYNPINVGDFPTTYLMSGDKDCVVFTFLIGATYEQYWAGKVIPNGIMPSTDYNMAAFTKKVPGARCRVLHSHDGAWNQMCDINTSSRAWAGAEQPSNYDGVTYFVWPYQVYRFSVIAGLWNEMYGRPKYIFESGGGAIVDLDSITCGAEIYTVLTTLGGLGWAMRTGVVGGANFPGRRLHPSGLFSPGVDAGLPTKTMLTAVVRGHAGAPHNAELRGYTTRDDPPV